MYFLLKTLIVLFSDKTNIRQFINPKNIPFIIINFNQLYYLKKLVNFALKRGFKKIIIIDNTSTYPPLLKYYEEIKELITIERMDKNYGHLVFLNSQSLLEKYGQNFFILTDADIVPNENLPDNFMRVLLWKLLKYFPKVLKVGFALRIDDIPSTFPSKEKVIKWEEKFWQNEIEKDLYEAPIDTTFAVYKPNFKRYLTEFSNFYHALRLAGKYTAKHGGWYVDYENMSLEEKYYLKSANKSSSWITKESKTNNDQYL